MAPDTLGKRLTAAMDGMKPADLARAANSTTATIANWMHDNVLTEHVKAVQLFKIADAVGTDARYLLTGERSISGTTVNDSRAEYASQPVQLDNWKMAFQLVAEALDDRGLTLPPDKRAEVTLLAHDLLVEGLQAAKVLHFVKRAAA